MARAVSHKSLDPEVALQCLGALDLGLFLVGWPGRVERYLSAQRSAHAAATVGSAASSAPHTP